VLVIHLPLFSDVKTLFWPKAVPQAMKIPKKSWKRRSNFAQNLGGGGKHCRVEKKRTINIAVGWLKFLLLSTLTVNSPAQSLQSLSIFTVSATALALAKI